MVKNALAASTPDHAGASYSMPPDPISGLRGRGREGKGSEGKREGEGQGREIVRGGIKDGRGEGRGKRRGGS